jgi:hypothetical protein
MMVITRARRHGMLRASALMAQRPGCVAQLMHPAARTCTSTIVCMEVYTGARKWHLGWGMCRDKDMNEDQAE